MRMRSKRALRILAAGLIAAMVLALAPLSALGEGIAAVVKSDVMYVAADPQGTALLGALPKGTEVSVTACADGVARILYNGHTGYAKLSDLAKAEAAAETAAAGSALSAIGASSAARAAVTAVDTRVFQRPDITSKSVKVPAGTSLNVLAVKGNIALVERGGVVGFAYRKHLTLTDAGASAEELLPSGGMSSEQLGVLKELLEIRQKYLDSQQASATPVTLEAMFESGKYSNEQLCYLFLTRAMGYNTAAAAGVLANINYESGFKTTVVGDNGASYGICQWYASRRSRLLDYCTERGLSPDSLLAQLKFLKYELENFYPAVDKYVRNVSDTPQGAYDAGYYFCYNFEAPASKQSQSVKRGQSAQNTYYPRYA